MPVTAAPDIDPEYRAQFFKSHAIDEFAVVSSSAIAAPRGRRPVDLFPAVRDPPRAWRRPHRPGDPGSYPRGQSRNALHPLRALHKGMPHGRSWIRRHRHVPLPQHHRRAPRPLASLFERLMGTKMLQPLLTTVANRVATRSKARCSECLIACPYFRKYGGR